MSKQNKLSKINLITRFLMEVRKILLIFDENGLSVNQEIKGNA